METAAAHADERGDEDADVVVDFDTGIGVGRSRHLRTRDEQAV